MDSNKNDNKKNIENKEFIDFNIDNLKDHLNTSFDSDDIIVSEDLIQKTLKAIETGEEPKIKDNSHRTVTKYPVYQWAGIAAAAFVLIAGITIVRNGFIKNEIVYEQSAETTTEMNTTTQDEPASSFFAKVAPSANDMTIAGSEEIEINSSFIENEPQEDARVNTTENAMDNNATILTGETVLFTDLLPSYDQAETITIRKEEGVYQLKNNLADTKKLYDLLGGFILTVGENLSGSTLYEIKIETAEKQIYTIIISDGIQLISEDGQNVQMNYFNLTNGSKTLITRLDEYVTSLN